MNRFALMIACLMLAFSASADETKSETKNTPDTQVNANTYPSSPDWANPDAPPRFNDRDETEPSCSDTDEPSFQPEPR